MKTHAPLPNDVFFSCPDHAFVPQNADECAESSRALTPHLPFLHTQHQGRGCFLCMTIYAGFGPVSPPGVVNRACSLLIRRRKAGRHERRQAPNALSPFFPRSVGFGPTDSCANGALFVLPSALCQSQATPSSSLYSANPAIQMRSNTPARAHAIKYAWIALPAPNSDFGNAFHSIPVRATYTIAASTTRFGIGVRPAPGARRYFRFGSRTGSGINGSTFAQNSSDIVQDLYRYGVGDAPWMRTRRRFDCAMHQI